MLYTHTHTHSRGNFLEFTYAPRETRGAHGGLKGKLSKAFFKPRITLLPCQSPTPVARRFSRRLPHSRLPGLPRPSESQTSGGQNPEGVDWTWPSNCFVPLLSLERLVLASRWWDSCVSILFFPSQKQTTQLCFQFSRLFLIDNKSKLVESQTLLSPKCLALSNPPLFFEIFAPPLRLNDPFRNCLSCLGWLSSPLWPWMPPIHGW